MSKKIKFKHLIIIGGQRCGTTFAINLLKKINKFKLTRNSSERNIFKNSFSYKEYLENLYKAHSRILIRFLWKIHNLLWNAYIIKKYKYFGRLSVVILIRDPIKERFLIIIFLKIMDLKTI